MNLIKKWNRLKNFEHLELELFFKIMNLKTREILFNEEIEEFNEIKEEFHKFMENNLSDLQEILSIFEQSYDIKDEAVVNQLKKQ